MGRYNMIQGTMLVPCRLKVIFWLNLKKAGLGNVINQGV
jgi:hypothetical protein